MQYFFIRFRKSLFYLAIAGLGLATPSLLISEGEIASQDIIAKIEANSGSPHSYTIVFNDVSVVEFIRFVSRITNLNFIFDEKELLFNVSIVSEEPVPISNIVSILIQVLRAHEFSVLEEGVNLFITKAKDVNQVATIVSSDTEENIKPPMALVTRVFRIKHANPITIAGILKPMLSSTATLEVSPETKQLIITDVSTNVNKISTLLGTLDSPHSPLEIESYTTKYADPKELISLATQIITPFANGDPLIFVPQEETHLIFIISSPHLIERTLEIFADLDIPDKLKAIKQSPQNVYLYKLHFLPKHELIEAIAQLVTDLKKHKGSQKLVQSLQNVKWIQESDSLFFIGDDETLAKVKDLVTELDSMAPDKKTVLNTFFVYKLQKANAQQFELSLDKLAESLEKATHPDTPLIEALLSMSYLKETNSFTFTGNASSLKKLEDILPILDSSVTPSSMLYLYKVEHVPKSHLENAIKQMSIHLSKAPLPDYGLIEALKGARYIKEINTFLFTGDAASLERLKEILPSLDSLSNEDSLEGIFLSNQFFIYNPLHQKGEDLDHALREIANNLKAAGLVDITLLQTVRNMKWVPATNTLIFTGTDASLKEVQNLLATLDKTQHAISRGEVFLYKPKNISAHQLQQSLNEVAQNLPSSNASDVGLKKTIHEMKWIDDSHSFFFRTTPATLEVLKEILATFDTSQEGKNTNPQLFFLYNLKYESGGAILKNLKLVAKDLEKSKVTEKSLASLLEHVQWIKDSNSLLLTGTNADIEAAKTIIERLDVPFEKSNFFMYTPLHRSGASLEHSLKDVSKSLRESGLLDTSLLNSLDSARYTKETNSLLFTGSAATIEKVKEILARIDTVSFGADKALNLNHETFFLYKIQNLSHHDIMKSLHELAQGLQHSGSLNQHVLECLDNVKFIEETNSLLFIGSPDTLATIEGMIQKVDLSASSSVLISTDFAIYKPKSMPGEELIKILDDFKKNLASSGVIDKSLFTTISNLKWIPKTSSILISGQQNSIEKVQSLLEQFDIVSHETQLKAASISTIQNSNFLIYKLKYHQGNEILESLKQITESLTKDSSAGNLSLANAINSLQWVSVTNSLLGTGDQHILEKLKELIENLDIPLRQIFIEILVIQTDMSSGQSFGLQWGGKMNYMNRFAAGTGNFPVADPTSPVNTIETNGPTNIADALLSTSSPNSSLIPILTGFDLGVIGDIIMHKGRSFLSLGSLVNALQADTNSTIVLNPKIIAQDNKTSTFFVGKNLPFTGSVVQTNTGLTSTSANLEYRDIGFDLSITPSIGTGNIITLDITNDISQVIGNPGATTSIGTTTILTGIPTAHTNMSTQVHVPDKHFVILSGMIQDTKTRARTAIPCLGGLPVIGAFFSDNDRIDTKSNVIIFLRPQIIDSFADYNKLTNTQEEVFKDSARLPVLKEDFDQGVDMVKTPENEFK